MYGFGWPNIDNTALVIKEGYKGSSPSIAMVSYIGAEVFMELEKWIGTSGFPVGFPLRRFHVWPAVASTWGTRLPKASLWVAFAIRFTAWSWAILMWIKRSICFWNMYIYIDTHIAYICIYHHLPTYVIICVYMIIYTYQLAIEQPYFCNFPTTFSVCWSSQVWFDQSCRWRALADGRPWCDVAAHQWFWPISWSWQQPAGTTNRQQQ